MKALVQTATSQATMPARRAVCFDGTVIHRAGLFVLIPVIALSYGCRRDGASDAPDRDAVTSTVEATGDGGTDRHESPTPHAEAASDPKAGVSASHPVPVDDGTGIPNPIDPDMQPQVRKLLEERRAAVVADPESALAWGRYGIACDAHKLLKCAEVCYRRARTQEPDEFEYTYFLAFILDAMGKGGDEAVTLYKEAIKLRPTYAPVHCRLGRALERRGRLDEAVDAYLQAIDVDPNFGMAYRAVGQALLGLDDPEGAVTYLEKALNFAPDDRALMAALSTAYRQAGVPTRRALASVASDEGRLIPDMPDSVRDIVRNTSVDSVSLMRRAKAEIHHGHHADAIPLLKTCESVTPDDPYVHIFLGTCYRRTGAIGLAIAHLRKAVRLKDDSSSAHFELAGVLLENGDLERGMKHYRQALVYAPDNKDIHIWIGAALMKGGFPEYAARAFEAAEEMEPIDARAQAMWGSALYKYGDFPGAIEHYQKAIELKPDYTDAFYDLGISFERSGKIDEAKSAFRQALQLQPNHPAADRLAALEAQSP